MHRPSKNAYDHVDFHLKSFFIFLHEPLVQLSDRPRVLLVRLARGAWSGHRLLLQERPAVGGRRCPRRAGGTVAAWVRAVWLRVGGCWVVQQRRDAEVGSRRVRSTSAAAAHCIRMHAPWRYRQGPGRGRPGRRSVLAMPLMRRQERCLRTVSAADSQLRIYEPRFSVL